MDDKPTGDPHHGQGYPPQPSTQRPGKGKSNTGWIIAVVLLCVMLVMACPCIGILAALLLPAVQEARDAARTMQSSNNLKQIGLALHSYHMAYGTFPPAYLPDENGKPMTSWRTMILPFLEQKNLHDMVDPQASWDDPANAGMLDVNVPVYQSPRETNPGVGMTNYVAMSGEDSILSGDRPTSIDMVRDGTTNTILVVEILNSDIPWFEPRDIDVDNYERVDDGGTAATTNVVPLRGVVLFADGSVHRLSEAVTREMLRDQSTKSGGEETPFWP